MQLIATMVGAIGEEPFEEYEVSPFSSTRLYFITQNSSAEPSSTPPTTAALPASLSFSVLKRAGYI